jgi:hypothetical protein
MLIGGTWIDRDQWRAWQAHLERRRQRVRRRLPRPRYCIGCLVRINIGLVCSTACAATAGRLLVWGSVPSEPEPALGDGRRGVYKRRGLGAG